MRNPIRQDASVVICLVFTTLISRIFLRSYGYDQYDVVLFKYGIDNLTPIHAPGYPIFLVFGRFLIYFTGNSLDSLICISIISSMVFVTSTFLIAKILFNDRFVALSSAILIMTNPTVWLYGIIGMSDMFQAAGVSLVVLFCAAAMKYNKSKFLYVSFIIFGITLGIKLSHALLIPLLIYTYIKVKDEKSIPKSLASFVVPFLAWSLPFYTLMASPQLKQATSGILIRDFSAFNVLQYGTLNKIKELFAYSAFIHYTYTILLLSILIFIIIIFYVIVYFGTKNEKIIKIKIDYSFSSIKRLFNRYNPQVFLVLWAAPYIAFNYIVLAPRLRYYLPVYPAFVFLALFLLNNISKLDTQKSLGTLNKYIPIILIFIIVAFSTYISLDTVSTYHENLDTRSQTILYYKDIGLKNAENGKESTVIINSVWGGRMDFQFYNIIYNSSFYTNMLETINYQPLKYPVSEKDLKESETKLISLMHDKYMKNKEVFLVGDLIGPPSPVDNIIFKLEKINTFYRPREWIIDDPQGYISIYRYTSLGEPLWSESNKIETTRSDFPIRDLKIGKLEDGNLYTFLFSHAPNTGIKFTNFSVTVPGNGSVKINILYGFAEGAQNTNGVNFWVFINGRNVLLDKKLYTSNLSTFSYNLSELKETKVDISLGIDPNGNNAYDWAVWIPTIIIK